MLACLSSGEAWKLFSRASVKGLLLCSGTFVHGGISEDRGLDSSPASPHGNPAEDIERAIASEWTRVEDTYGLERPLHGESLVYIHRQTTQRMAISHESWEPISVSREEFPELILEALLCRYLCAVARCHVVGMQNPPYLCCLSLTRPQRSQLCGCDGKRL